LKAAVVGEDERESGIRAYLNFGHTLGHAIEAADYRLLHGEAIAVGMAAAAQIGVIAGTCSASEAERIRELIGEFDLPLAARFEEGQVLERLKSDKKRVSGRQRFVLPLNGGGVTIRDDVPEEAVTRALSFVSLAGAPA
jgi:3-dehydroquinate synthetase